MPSLRHSGVAHPRLTGDQRGVTIVEFAMVLPVFLILVMGAMDMAYQMYTRAILSGEMQKAARDSTLESGLTSSSALDDKVKAAVKTVTPGASITFSRFSYRTFSDAAAAQAETWVDSNSNGTCDNGEQYEDANSNGSWDKNGGKAGQGGAKDAVVYTAAVSYPRLFPISKLIGISPTVTLTSTTVLRNQPYKDQDSPAPVARNCP